MALGATRSQVIGLVFSSTARNVFAGIACGVALSLAMAKVLSKWAEGSSQNPLIFVSVMAVLALVSGMAALIPARRASSVDPMVALRYE